MRFAARLAVSVTVASVLANSLLTTVVWGADATDNSAAASQSAPPVSIREALRQPDLLQNWNTVDGRIARLMRVVDIEKTAGSYTNEQADNFISALNQVAENEAEVIALAGKVPPATELVYQLTLDRLEQLMATSMHDRKLATLDLLGREQHLRGRIDTAESEGRLTKSDADALRAQLAAVLEDQQKRGGATGKMGYADALLESLQVDRIIANYGRKLQRRPFAVPDLQAAIDEVEQLEKKESKTGLERIRLLSQQLNHPLPATVSWKALKDKAVGPENALQLAMQLEWAKALMQQDLAEKDVAVNPSETEKALEASIGLSLDLGRLTPSEAQQWLADLDTLVAQHQSYTAGGNKLGTEQRAQLALSLARLQGRIDRSQHTPTRFWGGIDAFQTSLDARINQALQAKRLTAEQAADLKKAADAISSGEEGFKKTGTINGKQALAIATQLQQLNVKLHQALADRPLKAPDIDQLEATLKRTVSESVEAGKLDHQNHLVDSINHVAQLKQAYAQTSGGLDTRAKLAIGQAIEHNIAQLHAAIHNDQNVSHPSIDQRLTQLSEDVAQAGVSGVMSVERAAQYKAAVDTIYGELQSARKAAGGMQPAQTLAIANDIASLREQFDDELRDDATLPLHLMPRLKDLATRVGKALADGRLPLNEAAEMITQLDRTGERLAAAASTQGGLSHGEGLHLAYEIEALTDRLESRLRDEPIKVVSPQQKAAEVDTKVASALAAGKLTVDQAQELKRQFQHVMQDDASFERTDNSLSYPELLALNTEWDELGKLVDKTSSAGSRLNDITARRLQMEKRVTDAVANGKLNKEDASKLVAELDRLAQTEAAFRVSDERLDLQEAVTLSLDLDRLSAKVDAAIKGQLSLQQKH